MATWEAMICCQCGHPTAPMPYPYRWMTTCHVCSHKACLACNLSPDPNLYLNQGQQVSTLESTIRDANNINDLTEADSARAKNGGKSDVEIQEILDNGHMRDDFDQNLQAEPNICRPEDLLYFVEVVTPQDQNPFQQQSSDPTPPISSNHSGSRETQHLKNNTTFSNSETHVETIEEKIARMPRNLESEVLETWAWIDRFYPLATENGEEMPDVLADEPFFLPEETTKPDHGFSAP